MTCTSVQDNVVDHIALVFGVVEAERAAQVFREVVRCIVVVTGLHMHGEGISEMERKIIKILWAYVAYSISIQHLSRFPIFLRQAEVFPYL